MKKLTKGDFVFHKAHGIGVVDGNEEINGKRYVIIKQAEMQLKVPLKSRQRHLRMLTLEHDLEYGVRLLEQPPEKLVLGKAFMSWINETRKQLDKGNFIYIVELVRDLGEHITTTSRAPSFVEIHKTAKERLVKELELIVNHGRGESRKLANRMLARL